MVRKEDFAKLLLLSIVTCGIYYYIWIYRTTEDMNKMAGNDGHEINPTTAIILTIVTCGLYYIYWLYAQGNRIENVARSNAIPCNENGTTYLMWYLIGALIAGIGSWIGIYLFVKNYNTIAARFNGEY